MAVLFNMHFSMHLNMNYNICKIQHGMFCYSQQFFMQTTSVLLLVGNTTLYQILCQIILTLKLQTKSMKSSYWTIVYNYYRNFEEKPEKVVFGSIKKCFIKLIKV